MKLQGTQTVSVALFFFALVWKKIKLHGSQTTRWLRSKPNMLWRRVKLHGSQTSKISSENETKLWKKSKITWYSNNATLWCEITELSNSVTRSYGALEKGKIAWYSNISCMANQISPLWRRVKSYGSQINRGPIFLRTFLLERHKEIVGALVLTLSRSRWETLSVLRV